MHVLYKFNNNHIRDFQDGFIRKAAICKTDHVKDNDIINRIMNNE